MRVIAANAIASLAASSAAAAYPASNLLNNSPKRKWMAASAATTYAAIDITTTGVTGALALIGVVAEQVFVSVVDPTGIEWGDRVAWPEVVWDTSPGEMTATYELASKVEDYQNIWVSFPQFEAPVTIRVELRKNPTNPEVLACGVIQAGLPVEFFGVLYPLAEGMADHSIFHELANGAPYSKKRDRVRLFSGQMRLNRSPAARVFLRDLARVYGTDPLLYHLAPPWGDDFVVYARFSAMPETSHDTPNYSLVGFQLKEVL